MSNCNGDCNQGRNCDCMQDEITGAVNSLLWFIAAAVVCFVAMIAAWVAG